MTWKSIYPYDCVQYNAVSRRPFEDLSCLLRHYDKHHPPSPTLSPPQYCLHWLLSTIAASLADSYMHWEFTFAFPNKLPLVSWHCIAAVVSLSAIIMMVGRLHMYSRPPWQIRQFISVWNALWCLVSGVGFLRLAPLVWHNYRHYTIRDNVCDHAASLWTSGTTGLWATLWIYFKMVEVIVESILVVVLKQPCGLMQWFHNYAYVLVHGWHLVTSEIPGGCAVITVYYGIVCFMNAYCFHLNVCQLPQPTKPTALLDAIHLVQTLSGVVLSVVTLHYWKQAVWNQHQHQEEVCHANERHIRLLAFAWSGGHVVVAGLQALVQKVDAYDRQLRLLERKKRLQLQQHKAEKQRRLAAAAVKAVGSSQGQGGHNIDAATTNTKKTKKKKQIMVMAPARAVTNPMKQIPEADYEESQPELMEETDKKYSNGNGSGSGPNGNNNVNGNGTEYAASSTTLKTASPNMENIKKNGTDHHDTAATTATSNNQDSTVTDVTSNTTPKINSKKKKKRKKKKKSSSSVSASSSSVTSQTPYDSDATDYSQVTTDSSPTTMQAGDSALIATATLSSLQGQDVQDDDVWVKPKSSKTIRKRKTNHIKNY